MGNQKRELILGITDRERCSTGSALVVENGKILWSCKVLGLPWVNNAPYVSRAPKGRYMGRKRAATENVGVEHIEIMSVPIRTGILIHPLNWAYESNGCFGVGLYLRPDPTHSYFLGNSRDALKKLLSLLPDKFTIKII